MEFRKATLENGLEIVAECNPNAHSAAVGFFVRTGSRDETDEIAGVSHFLEHMVFKGTPNRAADQVNREFDELGAHYNAFTSEESTVYYASVLPEYLEQTVDLLADLMRPSLRQEDFEMEKKVILEEIQMYLDQPPFGMDDRLKEMHYKTHPIARSVLGTAESVSALTRNQMNAYFERRYSPNNLFIAASGKIDFEALVAAIEQRCGEWKRAEVTRNLTRATGGSGLEIITRENTAQQYFLQICDAPASEDHDRFAAKLLSVILGDDSGSRMYWDLVDTGKSESASLGHYEYQGVGMFYTWMSSIPENAKENYALLQKIFAKAEAEGIMPEELSQAKSKTKARIVLGSERPRNRLFNVGGNWLQRNEYRSVKEDLAAIESVSLEELHAVLKKYPLSKSTTISIGPLKSL